MSQHKLLTSLTGIIYQNNLHQQMSRRAVDDTVNGPQQGAPRLVMKHDDDAGVGQVIWVHLGFTTGTAT